MTTLAPAGNRVAWSGSFPPRPADPAELPPTLGEHVLRWVTGAGDLRLGEGDFHGEKIGDHLALWQRYATLKLYELWPADPAYRSLPPSKWRELRLPLERRYRRACVLIPKGNGKGPWAAAIAAAELAGAPVMFGGWTDDGEVYGVARTSPIVSLGAASFDQAALVTGDLAAALEGSTTLSPHVEVMGALIRLRDRPGYAKRVTSASGSNDGMRSSVLILDEVHELIGEEKERFATVVSGGLAKRSNSLSLFISTAGVSTDSLLGRLYIHGKRVNAGLVRDDQFLFLCWEGPVLKDDEWDDPEKLRELVLSCNPAHEAGFLRVDDVVARRYTIELWRWRRYHANHWDVGSDQEWLPAGSWDACRDPDAAPLRERERIQVALDGSWNNDSTALVAHSLERPFIEVLGHWERPAGAPADWHVAILEVEQTIREAAGRFRMRGCAADPARWSRSIALLGEEGLPMEVFSQSPQAMGPATEEFYTAVVNGLLTHDGDLRLAEHLRNARTKVGQFGTQLVKQTKNSPHKIDLAVAAIMARARALVPDEAPPPEVAFFNFDDL